MKTRIFFMATLLMMLVYASCDNTFVSKQVPKALDGLTNTSSDSLFYGFNWLNGKDIIPGEENVVAGESVKIEGWAIDPISMKTATKVFLSVNGNLFTTEYGSVRDDVAAYFKNPAYKNCGFVANIPGPVLPAGKYSLELKITGEGKTTYISGTADKILHIQL